MMSKQLIKTAQHYNINTDNEIEEYLKTDEIPSSIDNIGKTRK